MYIVKGDGLLIKYKINNIDGNKWYLSPQIIAHKWDHGIITWLWIWVIFHRLIDSNEVYCFIYTSGHSFGQTREYGGVGQFIVTLDPYSLENWISKASYISKTKKTIKKQAKNTWTETKTTLYLKPKYGQFKNMRHDVTVESCVKYHKPSKTWSVNDRY